MKKISVSADIKITTKMCTRYAVCANIYVKSDPKQQNKRLQLVSAAPKWLKIS